MNFSLIISTDTDDRAELLAHALDEVATLFVENPPAPTASGAVADMNGNTIGSWSVSS